jgi:hypothetical protein
MEIEAIVGAVVELGEQLGVQMPATRAVYACTKFLDERRERRAPRPDGSSLASPVGAGSKDPAYKRQM